MQLALLGALLCMFRVVNCGCLIIVYMYLSYNGWVVGFTQVFCKSHHRVPAMYPLLPGFWGAVLRAKYIPVCPGVCALYSALCYL